MHAPDTAKNESEKIKATIRERAENGVVKLGKAIPESRKSEFRNIARFLGDINTDITTCNIVVFDISRKSLKHTVYCLASSAVPRAADRRKRSTCRLTRFMSHPTVCCSLARVNIACVHLASPRYASNATPTDDQTRLQLPADIVFVMGRPPRPVLHLCSCKQPEMLN